MKQRIVHFFQEINAYRPTQQDVDFVTNLLDELQKIKLPENEQAPFYLFPPQRAFVTGLVSTVQQAYTQYRITECGGLPYRAYREYRATWKSRQLEDGPAYARERMHPDFWWRSEGPVDRVQARAVESILKEINEQLLSPLQAALQADNTIVKRSRVYHLLDYLKTAVGREENPIFKTLEEAEAFVGNAENAARAFAPA